MNTDRLRRFLTDDVDQRDMGRPIHDVLSAAADEIDRLRAALRPFATGVFNDNGDVTVTRPTFALEDVERAYWSLKREQD